MNPGVAFGENIKTDKIRRRSYSGSSSFRVKKFLLLLLLAITIIIFFFRLVYLQIFQGTYYRKLSDSNRIRTQVIYAPRGIILDRNGAPLVLNIPGFREILNNPKNNTPPKAILLDKEQALKLMAKGETNIAIDSIREYPFKEILAHVLGYIGQITKDQLQEKQFANYTPNDLVGKTGIEQEYENLLRGQNGQKLIEVDSSGREVRSLGQSDPIAGHDITLTLDIKLQQAAYSAGEKINKGAIIVSRPNGEILAMLSKPTYDPNLFTQNTTYHTSTNAAYMDIDSILSDSQNQPLLNRAIGGTYPPGSTFKLIVAGAGLEDRVIDENYHITDTGILKIGDFSFANWYYTDYGLTEKGDVNVVRAIARSNDIFFYKIAALIGVDKLSSMAEKFGLGKPLGIDLPGEAAGIVPTRTWKNRCWNDTNC